MANHAKKPAEKAIPSTFSIPRGLNATFRAHVFERGESASAVVVRLIEAYLGRKSPKGAKG